MVWATRLYPYLIADFMQGTYHGISSHLCQLPRDIVYPWGFSLVERFLSCLDLFQQDWVVISSVTSRTVSTSGSSTTLWLYRSAQY